MAKTSAGLLMFRRKPLLEVFLVHPGGPYWAAKDAGAWTIPKGEVGEGEEFVAAAKREFNEETGFDSSEPLIPLGSVKLKSGKTIQAWAFEGDCDARRLRSNLFEVEWPPRSGKVVKFPEADRGEWFNLRTAQEKIHPAQAPLLERLAALV